MTTGMKKRTINLKIESKMKRWIETLPEELQKMVKRDVIVTGGSIASMLLGEQVNDYDVYFKTKHTVVAVAEHYLAKFIEAQKHKNGGGVKYDMKIEELIDSQKRERVRIKIQSAGVAGEEQTEAYQYFESQPDELAGEYIEDVFDQQTGPTPADSEKPKYRPVFLSSNAITLSDNVQVIIRFWGDVDEIHKNFDFVHCMNYWTFSDGVVLRLDSLEALMSKTLIYLGSLYPVCSVFRARKFIERGWSINAGQYLKMILQCSELDLSSYMILEEQLTGVDAAYFSDLLSKARDKDNPERVDKNYLVEIINRMF
jgi:hypothetical protein